MTRPDELFGLDTTEELKNTNNKRRIRSEKPFTLYPLAKLAQLARKISISDDENKPIVLRYVVDRNKHLWFAEEGVGPSVPTHGEMTTEPCLAAGNVQLTHNKRTNHITLIHMDNKSGDIHPEYHRIKWPLLIFLINPSSVLLQNTLNITPLFPTGSPLFDTEEHIATYGFSRKELIDWKNSFDKEFLATLEQQPKDITKVCHKKAPRFFATETAPRKRLRPILESDPSSPPGSALFRSPLSPRSSPESTPETTRRTIAACSLG